MSTTLYGFPVKLAVFPPGHIHEGQQPTAIIDLVLKDTSPDGLHVVVPRLELDLKAIADQLYEAVEAGKL